MLFFGGKKIFKKRRPAHTAFSSTRNKSWTRKNKRQRSFLGRLHVVQKQVQFSPGCIFADVLPPYSTSPPVGDAGAESSASRNRRRAARCLASGLRSAAAADWWCALGDALNTVALQERGNHPNRQLSQTFRLCFKQLKITFNL